MIIQEQFWKDDLKKTSNKLFLRYIQKRWTERSIFIIEKEVFYGFFAVRKLMDSNGIENKTYNVLSIPKNTDINSTENLDFDNCETISLNMRQICNQFIHSYHFIPVIIKSGLSGFIVSSDFIQEEKILFVYLITVTNIFSDAAKGSDNDNTNKE